MSAKNGIQSTRQDGALINVLSGMGDPRHDRSTYTSVNARSRLTWRLTKEQKEALIAVRIINRICAIYPSQALRRGWKLNVEGDKDDVVRGFEDYCDRLKLKTKVRRFLTLARQYGGAVLVIVADDGRKPSEPLNKDGIRSIQKLVPLDCYKIRPVLNSWEPLEPDAYELLLSPKTFEQFSEVKGLGSNTGVPGYMGYPIHPSRILRCDGVEIPSDLMIENDGWGKSIPEDIQGSYTAWESAFNGVLNSLLDHDVFVMKIEGLFEKLAQTGGEGQVANRLHALKMGKSILKGLAIDRDKEDATYVTRNVQGISDTFGVLENRLIGDSEVSHAYLFGRSPSGLGATGESEERQDAKKFQLYQEDEVVPHLDLLFDLIWRAKDSPTKGQVPKNWSYEMNSLIDPNPQDEATLESTKSTTLSTYQSIGAILVEEIREGLKNEDKNIGVVWDDKLWNKKKEEEETGGFDFGGGMPAEEPPPEEVPPEEQQVVQQDSAYENKEAYAIAYSEARKKFKVFPSAYSNHWLDKRYRELNAQKYNRYKKDYAK